MANEEHLAILRQGVEAWNAWRAANPGVVPDLRIADLSEARLRGMNFYGANLRMSRLIWADLRETDFQYANLGRCDLREADLHKANLRKADLHGAHFTGTHLREAELSDADLSKADFNGTDLRGANLTRALVAFTIFGNLDLREVLGLESILHDGPSTLGADTFIKSRGKIPEVFLRGCGVPESFIDYLPSLIGAMEPIQFYSCFISYSTKDEEFAKRLHSKMRDNNIRVWFANEDLKGGHKLHEQIDEAIRVYDKLILVLSPQSINSKWVRDEVRRTRKAELTGGRRKFFPITLMDYKKLTDWECIDPETGTDLAAEIREYYIPDFRLWKNHNAFEAAFAKLLEGLKAVDEPPAPRVAPQDMPQEPERIIARKKQRLAILEEQAAITGYSVRPEVAMEIDELKKEIARLEGRG
jgi:hypothetical protein